MRKCPVCNIDLTQKDYEGFIVMQCDSCGGHLIPLQRFESIKRMDIKTKNELQHNATESFKANTTTPVKCPRCHLIMKKESVNIPAIEIQTDICKKCSLIWLDGGELAILQLLHQSKGKFAASQEMRRRMENLEADPERKARFEEALAKLPPPEYAPKNILSDTLYEIGDELIDTIIFLSDHHHFST